MGAKIEYLYYETRSPQHYQDLHRHHCYEIVYYRTGVGYTNIDKRPFPYHENTFSFMNPFCNHDRHTSMETEFIAIGFSFDFPVTFENGVFYDSHNEVLRRLNQMKEEMFTGRIHYRFRLELLVQDLVIELDRMLNGQRKAHEEEWHAYVKNYMDLHFNEKINLQTLASLTAYSYDRFRHKFKESTGFSPHHYLLVKRLESAKEKLLLTNKSVTEISQECGFSSSSQFCHLFKKRFNEIPSKFRIDKLFSENNESN
ncbi:AraC-like DNA-binding protein [Paenibacillus rhizosphaerae]|uniref:AraC-like DNA-binding protein n=1 Tax=Paenibacillus rhizosphaerae TaxID=297318 RepID=A0A839TTP6_9BACL|nr:AraC family transcriptional regulator [Paenibacillus rhizosphaerae]MBB3128659.1 AraC-like DNA-binding protein [Paenibacillus rhizosphaerae]